MAATEAAAKAISNARPKTTTSPISPPEVALVRRTLEARNAEARNADPSGVVAVLLAIWNTLVTLLANLWQAAGHMLLAPAGLSGPAVTALAVVIVVGALATGLAFAARIGRISAAIPLTGRASALREKSWRAAFLRQRDPDAAGRPRPRAPSSAPAAA